MKRPKKKITMLLTVSVPHFVTASQARKEVRSLIENQTFTGQRLTEAWDECHELNFRIAKLAAVPAIARLEGKV